MNGDDTDDIILFIMLFIDGDQQYVWWRVVNHELVPLVRRKHRFASELSEVRPSLANGSIEHCTNLLSIACDGASNKAIHSGRWHMH